ncbi:MAG: tetratricopeptide repeat protein [Alphaproteobacteria bacterium]
MFPNVSSDLKMPIRLRRMSPVLVGLLGVTLLAIGIPRLSAEMTDLPGNGAANALAEGAYVNPEGAALVLETRKASLSRDPNARRWFAVGRALMVTGDPEASADAIAAGLLHAPGNGVIWAEYARALDKSGQRDAAKKAAAISVDRAPHDPRARRIRRQLSVGRK